MIKVKIHQHEIDNARELAEKTRQVKQGLASTISSNPDRDIIGGLGELAVKKYLKAIGIEYKESEVIYTKNWGDKYDLLIGNKKVDVKSTKKYDCIVLNSKQYYKTKKKGIDWLIGVTFGSSFELATIIGYGLYEDLRRDDEKDILYKGEIIEMYSISKDRLRQFKNNDIEVDY